MTTKRIFLFSHLFLITIIALIVADGVNFYLKERLSSFPSLLKEVKTKKKRIAKRISFPNEEIIIKRDLFGATEKKENLKGAVKKGKSTYTASSSFFVLKGTIIREGDKSIAIIENRKNRIQKLYKEGETIEKKGKVLKVRRNEVIIEYNGKKEVLKLEFKQKRKNLPRFKRRIRRSYNRGIHNVSKNSWVLSEKEVDLAFRDFNRLMTQIRVVPNFDNNRSNGYRVIAIKPNSIFAKLGLRPGDVIQRINGLEITTPEKAFEAYHQLRNEKDLELDLIRRGRKLTFNYQIR